MMSERTSTRNAVCLGFVLLGLSSGAARAQVPPTIVKSFAVASIQLNGITSLTFTIQNPNGGSSLTGVAFSDSLPTGPGGGLVVATPNGLTGSCGSGTITAPAGSGFVSLSGGTLAPSASCTFSVTVKGNAVGVMNNTTTNVTSVEGGAGGTASASLSVQGPPVITSPASATFTVGTAGSFTVTTTGLPIPAISVTGSLPSGVTFVDNGNGTGTLSGSPAPGSAPSYPLTFTASNLISPNATQLFGLFVFAPPVIIKAFGAASIPANGSTSLTFTIQNNNTTTTLTGIGFSDTLPAGLVVSTPNGLTGSCGGGTITATQATSVISLTGSTLAASTSCTFAVNVTGTAGGTKNNTTGNVTSTEGGTGGTASASINVVAPPTIAKAFGAAAIPVNGTTSLTFTLTNPPANAVGEAGVAFTDTLPAGLIVAASPGLTSTCGGTATAVAGSGSVSLTGGTIAASGTCSVVVNVTGTTSGTKNNTTGSVTSTNGGTGNTASASIAVATPPTITKAFGAASVGLNGSTSLTFTITNPASNTIALTGLAFTDNLPAGLVVSTPNGLSNTCGGAATAVAGAFTMSLSGGTLATNTSCTLAVNVTGTVAGVKNNSVQVTSTEAGTGNTSSASITVVAPPVIIKAFGAASIPVNGSTSLTFTIQNNNTVSSLSGVGFTDNLPAGLAVSTPNGLTGSCGSGTITTTAGSGSASLSGATLAANASCTFAVNVTGNTVGVMNNTTGNVTSVEGGAGGTASASLSVQGPPVITSPASATFTVGVAGSFTVTTTGFPIPAILVTGSLPSGVTFVDNGNGTGTLSGTPGSGSAPSYPLTFTASNGVNPNAAQTFTLNVGAAAAQDVPALGSVALAVLAVLLALAGAFAGRGRLLG